MIWQLLRAQTYISIVCTSLTSKVYQQNKWWLSDKYWVGVRPDSFTFLWNGTVGFLMFTRENSQKDIVLASHPNEDTADGITPLQNNTGMST